ncbi:unnamed protein product [Owenia fusiformis]|uniref:Uncharacterized protein n=1 Tax=Owenia fusiformis TaxID=6347 RepID=A0A8J1UL22_OWEFU|nr:unnamed protein product [Owenia fusiformis]
MDVILRYMLPTIIILAILSQPVLSQISTTQPTKASTTEAEVLSKGELPSVFNLQREARTVSTITVAWSITTDDVLFYRITCSLKQSTFPISQDPNTTLTNGSKTSHTIDNLYHAALYEISVTAGNRYGSGNAKSIEVWTDIEKPPAPPIPRILSDEIFETNFTMSLEPVGSMTTGPLSGFLVVIEKMEPDGKNSNFVSTNSEDTLVNYTEAERLDLNHYITAEILFIQLQLPAKFIIGDLALYNGYFNAPLQPDTPYNVHFGVISRLDNSEKITFCDPVEVTTSESNEKPYVVHEDDDSNTVVIIAVSASTGVIILIIITIIVVVMLRKYKFKKSESDNKNNSLIADSMLESRYTLKSVAELTLTTDKVRQKMEGILKHKTIVNDPSENLYIHNEAHKSRQRLQKKKSLSNGINIADLETEKENDHMKQLTAEFAQLKIDTIQNISDTSIVASIPENIDKNPFGSRFLPFDGHRVKVGDTNDPHYDYINATHVEIKRSNCEGILTVIAMPNTMELFWTMLYEQEVETLVSLDDNPFEDFKETVSYNTFRVNLTSENQFADFTKRTFVVYCERSQETRQLTQWQYNTWTKGGIPEETFAFIEFISLVMRGAISDAPIVVESLDGVGRTGMFWALVLLREQGQKTGKINVPKCVQKLRTFNQYYVKTNKQYVFIYQAIIEIFRMGYTHLPRLKMKASIKNITANHPETGISHMRKQYDFIYGTPHVDSMYGTPHVDNPVNDLEYMNSHCNYKQFAITQKDFMENIIELSYEAETKCIILLDDTFEDEVAELEGVNKKTLNHGIYTVKYIRNTKLSNWNIKTWNMKIRTMENPTMKQILLIKTDNWSANNKCPPIQTILNLIQIVDNKTRNSPYPVMINTILGLDRAALVVGMLSIYQRLKHHDQTSIYIANMIMKQSIPQLHLYWGQYKYFYKATAEIEFN